MWREWFLIKSTQILIEVRSLVTSRESKARFSTASLQPIESDWPRGVFMNYEKIRLPAYHHAIQLLFSQKPVNDGMQDLDVFVRNLVPHPIWDELREINYADELSELTERVRTEISSHPENTSILFFCLSDLGDQMSLMFLRQTREPENDRDWGAYDDSVWSDVPSKALKQMHELAELKLSNGKGGHTNSDVYWIIEACFALAFVGLSVGEIMRKLPISALLGKDAIRRVAVFFGEGDDFFLGEISMQGFKYYKAPDFAL